MLFLPAFLLVTLSGLAAAQRPSNASVCDYYAQQLYGANNSQTQYQLVQGIVALAFAGTLNNGETTSNVTGIMNPGSFQGIKIDLQGYFDGYLASTNLNNQPVGINWLDDGGLEPLRKYLSNQTSNVLLTNTTNQYRLFSHFLLSFSHQFGCSEPPTPPPSSAAPISLAYAHKFMNLSYADLGYFLQQISTAAKSYGFSDQDSQTLNTAMSSRYNVRCAPPVTLNAALGPELLSLCQAPDCPLAEPSPDCAPYANITANGLASDGTSANTSTGPSPTTSIEISSSTATSLSTSSDIPTNATVAGSSANSTSASGISVGGIAGSVVGGVAVLALSVCLFMFFIRRRKPKVEPAIRAPENPPPSYAPHSNLPRWNKDVSQIATSDGPIIAATESHRRSAVPSMSQQEYASPEPHTRTRFSGLESHGESTITSMSRHGSTITNMSHQAHNSPEMSQRGRYSMPLRSPTVPVEIEGTPIPRSHTGNWSRSSGV